MYPSEIHAALLFLTSICYIYIPTRSTYRKAVGRDCSSSIRKRFTTTKDILSTLFSFHIFLLKKNIYLIEIYRRENFHSLVLSLKIILSLPIKRQKRHLPFLTGQCKLLSFYSEQTSNIFRFLRLQNLVYTIRKDSER